MSGIYISLEMRKARSEIRRTTEECIKISNELYPMLKEDMKRAEANRGRDYITYTPDRKIGKTYNLMRLAAEYDYPLIVHDAIWARCIEKQDKKLFNKSIIVRSYRVIPNRFDGLRCDVILKDETVDISTLRDVLNNNGFKWCSVVGFN